MSVEQMWIGLVKDRLRNNYREAVNTLIAAGISEQDAECAAADALASLWWDGVVESRKGPLKPGEGEET